MKTQENKKWEIFIFILCVCILSPLIIIGIYNRPSADDYDYAIWTHRAVQNGGGLPAVLSAAWETSKIFYKSWQGLYSSAFLLALQPGIWGEKYYAFTTVMVLGFAYLSLLGSVYILNKHFLRKSFVFTLTAPLVLLTMLVLWLPSPVEGLYWFNGAMNYMPWAFFNVLNLCLLYEAGGKLKTGKGKVLLLLCTVLSFLISGGNHVTAFANILFLLIASVYLLTKKRFFPLLPFVMACVGFVIMYIAPGTAIRQATTAQQGVVKTIVETIKHVRLLAGEWVSLKWMVSLAAVTPAAMEIARKNKERMPKRFPWLPIVLSVGVICGMFCVPYFAMGSFGAGRLTNVIWITFMFLSWSNYVLIWGFLASNNYVDIEKIHRKKYSAAVRGLCVSACLLLLFFISDNSQACNAIKAVNELKNGTARSYCYEMDMRIEKYNNTEEEEAAVQPLQVKSKLLFFADIGPDPEVWPNTSISKYYGKAIYLVP